MKWAYVFLLVPFCVLAASRIGSPHLLGYHHFRQAHDAMTARHFATDEPSLLKPTIDGVTYGKDLYINEFPLYPYMVGLLWRVFGERLVLARLLSVAFALAAFWYYARLVGRFTGDRLLTAAAVAVLSLCPVVSYFARSVQRQSLFLFLVLAGVTHVAEHVDRSRPKDLLLGAASLSLALLLNPFAVYLAAPLGWYAAAREGRNLPRRWPLLLAGALAVVPACAWYAYSLRMSGSLPTGGMLGITAPEARRDFLSLSHYAMWLDAGAWARALRILTRYVVPPASSFALCLWGAARAPAAPFRFFKIWAAAAAAYLLVDFYPAAVVVHHYYYINLAPPLALFLAWAMVSAGRALWPRLAAGGEPGAPGPRQGRAAAGAAALALCAALFVADGYSRSWSMAQDAWHEVYYAHCDLLRKAVEPGARVTIVAESNDPLLSYVLSPFMTHRLVQYRPQRLERIVADGDFDYLALVSDTARFPLEDAVRAVEASAALGRPVLQRTGLLLYRNARRPGRGGASE